MGDGRSELTTDPQDFEDEHGSDRLLHALEQSEFILEYQPIVPLSQQGAFGVEALVRWAVPGENVVMPGHFVPSAEECGSIVTIGSWIFEEACEQFARWTQAKVNPGIEWISINLSPRQLDSDGTADVFVEAVHRTAVDPKKIMLEVTESAILDDRPELWHQLDRLHQVGMRVALDDFGTRYSMLSHLQHSSVDAVKVDRSFIAELATDGRNRTIVEGVVSLAHDLGLTVVAEGVETAAELDAVRTLGADYAQGYHFARPANAGRMASVISLLRSKTSS